MHKKRKRNQILTYMQPTGCIHVITRGPPSSIWGLQIIRSSFNRKNGNPSEFNVSHQIISWPYPSWEKCCKSSDHGSQYHRKLPDSGHTIPAKSRYDTIMKNTPVCQTVQKTMYQTGMVPYCTSMYILVWSSSGRFRSDSS